MGGISFWQLGIILLVVIVIFGTKKLRNMGPDLGAAVKGFKKAMSDDKQDADFEEPRKVEKQQAESAEQPAEKTKQQDNG